MSVGFALDLLLSGHWSFAYLVVLGCELCFDEVFAPVGVDELLSVAEELELDRGACDVLDCVVTGFDATDVYCLVADCGGVHFVSLSLWLAYVYNYTL